MAKPERSPTSGKFVKRGLLSRLAAMFAPRRAKDGPLLLTDETKPK